MEDLHSIEVIWDNFGKTADDQSLDVLIHVEY